MDGLASRTRAGLLLEEAARFLVVGGLATAVSLIGFNALVHGTLVGNAPLEEHPVAAYVAVNLIGGIIAYLGMRLWAFSHRDGGDPLVGLVNFFVLGALTMTIPVFCLAVSRYGLGRDSLWADNISANVIGLGLGTAARFWVFRRYVFIPAPAPVGQGP